MSKYPCHFFKSSE